MYRVVRTRFHFAALVIGVALIATACSSAPSGTARSGSTGHLQTLTVQTFSGSVLNLPLYVAQQNGYYAQHGLKVTFVPISNGPLSVEAVQSGHLDIAYGSFGTPMAAAAKGFNIQAIVADTDHNYWTLVVKKGIPLPNLSQGYPAVMKDLRGLTIGVNALGAQSEFDVKTMFAAAGMSPNSATFIAVGSSDTAFAALKSGEVDAIQAFDPTQSLAIGEGLAVAAVDMRRGQGPKVLQEENGAYQLFFASTSFIKSHKAAINGFIAAQVQAESWLKNSKNLPATLALAEKTVALGSAPNPRSILLPMLKLYQQNIWGATISPTAIRAGDAYLLKYGLIAKSVNPSQFVYSGAPKP